MSYNVYMSGLHSGSLFHVCIIISWLTTGTTNPVFLILIQKHRAVTWDWGINCSTHNQSCCKSCAVEPDNVRYVDDNDFASVDELFQSVDDKLFEKIVCNSVHVLQPLIPDRPPSSYDLRLRSHDKLLLNKTSYRNDREFIIRMLYKDSYWLLLHVL